MFRSFFSNGAGDNRPSRYPELDRELAYHFERRAQELIEAGVDPEEAALRARNEFGDVETTRAYCSRLSQRVEKRVARRRVLADLTQDVKFAVRGLRRSPGFTLVVVLIMALGVGATSAVFSIINSVLLRPLDYPEPDRLVQLWETDRIAGSLEDPVSPVDLRDWKARAATFEGLAGYGYQALALSGDGPPERLVAVETSASFFEVLAVEPALGRTFEPAEEGPAHRVAVLSDRLWRTRFNAEPEALGRVLVLDGTPYLVVGVMPEGFAFPSSAELWVPFTFDVDQLSRGSHFLFAVGRLAEAASLAQAGAEMQAIAAQIETEYPEFNANQSVNVVPLHDQVVGGSSRALWVIFGAVTLVLAIACGNVANMLLVRAAGRSEEIAIRTALGAGRWRLARQLLAEGVALSFVSAAIGVLAAGWGLDALVAAIPVALPRASEVTLDYRVLLFAVCAATFTGIAFGLGPAMQAKPAGAAASASGRTTSSRHINWLRDGIVVAEVALSLVVLVTAGLLIANLSALREVDPGFRAESVLTARISLPSQRYDDAAQRIAFVERLRAEVSSIPGVEAYGTVDSLPFSGSRSRSSFDIVGAAGESEQPLAADRREVTPGYFGVLQIPVLRGRDVDQSDTREAPGVVLVNSAFAERFFPGAEALGQRIVIGDPDEVALYGEAVEREVIGIVGNIIHDDLTATAAPEMYVPYHQNPSGRIALALRTRGAPGDTADLVRAAVLRVDPDQPVYDLRSMESRLSGFLALARSNAWALGVFSTVALTLAALGIYSVISFTVAQREHELGVRVALGASAADIVRLVARRGTTHIAAGLVLGVIGAGFVAQGARALLFQVDTTDPRMFVLPVAVLVVAGLTASLVPALRALRVDPIEVLRRD